MLDLDARWWIVAALIGVAIAAGIADWRCKRRRDLDRIGPIYWPTVQMLAMIAAVVMGAFILHA